MADFGDKRLDGPSAPERDFYSQATCKCGKDSAITLFTVVNTRNGEIKTGGASEFSEYGKDGNCTWKVRSGYRLQSSQGYCADCFAGDGPCPPSSYSPEATRKAFRWLLGETLRDSESPMAGLFPPLEVTSDQRDKCIEIVNHEAKRVNEPDAIPDEYKLPEVLA